MCDTGQSLYLSVLVSTSINRDKSKPYGVVRELNWLIHVKQFESCLTHNKHSAQENSLFITITVSTSVVTISFLVLEPCRTSSWPCPVSVQISSMMYHIHSGGVGSRVYYPCPSKLCGITIAPGVSVLEPIFFS